MHKKTKPMPNQLNGVHAGPRVVEVTFALQDAKAKEVYVCGDFNDWSPTSAPMTLHEGNGRWEKRLALPPGRYEYKFVVDGEWIADPGAKQNSVNTFGSINSIVEVRP